MTGKKILGGTFVVSIMGASLLYFYLRSARQTQLQAVPFSISETRLDPQDEARPAREGMVWIRGGSYARGCFNCDLADSLPIHRVRLTGFWLDETPVTNEQFTHFVDETHYVTIAERVPKAEDFPDVPKDQLVPGSAVFVAPDSAVPLVNALRWWKYQPGASWRQPEGPGSAIASRNDHPAVHIAFFDAEAYCKHVGKRLVTEAEFEFAARGGLEGKLYSWGDDLKPGGRWLANIWQGHFPNYNQVEDGYRSTSPVKAFPPNGYGLYDMSGNVWQWTSDWYRSDYYQTLANQTGDIQDPKGPTESFDPQDPDLPKRVQRGGSFLCSAEYCTRYLVASRGKGDPGSAGSNTGFRCAQN